MTTWDDNDRIRSVPIALVRPGPSPRTDGVDDQYALALAESVDELPPIVVNRRTMEILDGHHRLRAAQLAGATQIPALLVDVDDDMAFVIAVEANVAHGLPLSLADRRAAAGRILREHPDWSDRAVATVTGLGARTVAGIRERDGLPAPASRIGLDGRARPSDPVERRLWAARSIACAPETPLREIAAAAGISPATALDVRSRLSRNENPVPDGLHRRGSVVLRALPVRQEPASDRHAALDGLKRDPTMRFTDSGRAVLRWITTATALLDRGQELAGEIPPGCRGTVAALARMHAQDWLHFAEQLERRATATA